MANTYADMIIALNATYQNTVSVLTNFRVGVYTPVALDNAKAAVAQYKLYASQRVKLEVGSTKNKRALDIILNDLGEAPIFIEKNITLIRTYLSVYDPTYVEPAL